MNTITYVIRNLTDFQNHLFVKIKQKNYPTVNLSLLYKLFKQIKRFQSVGPLQHDQSQYRWRFSSQCHTRSPSRCRLDDGLPGAVVAHVGDAWCGPVVGWGGVEKWWKKWLKLKMILKYGIWCGNSLHMMILIQVYIKEIWLIKNFCTTYDIAIWLQPIYQKPAFLHSLSTCDAITLTWVANTTGPFVPQMWVAPPTEDWKVPAATQCWLSLCRLSKTKKKRPMAQPNSFWRILGFSFTLFVEERKLHHHAMVILVTESLPWNRGFWAAGSSLHDVIKHHQLIWKNIIKNIIIIKIILIIIKIYSYSLHSTILSLSLLF